MSNKNPFRGIPPVQWLKFGLAVAGFAIVFYSIARMLLKLVSG